MVGKRLQKPAKMAQNALRKRLKRQHGQNFKSTHNPKVGGSNPSPAIWRNNFTFFSKIARSNSTAALRSESAYVWVTWSPIPLAVFLKTGAASEPTTKLLQPNAPSGKSDSSEVVQSRIKGEFTAGTAKQFSYLIMVRFWQQASYGSGVAKVPLTPTLLPFRYLNTNRIGMTTTLWTLVTASVRGVLSIDRSRLDHDLRDLGLRRQTHGTQNLSVPSVVPR